MQVFEAAAIEIRPQPVARGGWPTFELVDPSGVPLGTMGVTGVSWDGRVRRWFGNAAEYPFRLAPADSAGSLLLLAEKARENALRHLLRFDVALADGSPVGRVERRTLASARITFATDEHAVVASAPFDLYTRGLRVEREPDLDVVWAESELVGAPRLGRRSYRLTFADDTPLLVRMLLVTWTVGADAQLLPDGGDF